MYFRRVEGKIAFINRETSIGRVVSDGREFEFDLNQLKDAHVSMKVSFEVIQVPFARESIAINLLKIN